MSHANRYHDQAKQNPGYDQTQSAPESTGPNAIAQETTAEDRKEAREEADLRAQERMAVATENAFNVSIFSLIFLAATVIFAGLAWNAAADGAKAAWKTEKTTRDIGYAQSRAYVHVPKSRIVKRHSGNALAPPYYYAALSIKNEGTTLAKNVEIFFKFGLEFPEYEGTVWNLESPKKRLVPNIAPSQTLEWNLTPALNLTREKMVAENAKVDTILGARYHFCVWGEVHYTDVHHMRHRSAFQFQTVYPEIDEREMIPSLIHLPVFETIDEKK